MEADDAELEFESSILLQANQTHDPFSLMVPPPYIGLVFPSAALRTALSQNAFLRISVVG
jgi:hypothetical protein